MVILNLLIPRTKEERFPHRIKVTYINLTTTKTHILPTINHTPTTNHLLPNHIQHDQHPSQQNLQLPHKRKRRNQSHQLNKPILRLVI